MLVEISNDPVLTGIKRKVFPNLHWLSNETIQRVVISCLVKYFDDKDEEVINNRIRPYTVELEASNSLVHPSTGILLTLEETQQNPQPDSVTEYYYYAEILGKSPIIVSDIMKNIILLRDQQGRFNI